MNLTNKIYLTFFGFCILFFNEFTLVKFDNNPPLSDKVLLFIRIIDFLLILMAFLGSYFVRIFLKFSKTFSNFSMVSLKLIFPIFISVIFLDVALSFLGFGYPSHFEQENIERYPSPGDGFAGKPNVHDHNEYGFRGHFEQNQKSLAIALFGGSTGYHGDPTILESIKKKLSINNLSVDVFNFSSISSNHTQHLHRLIKHHDRFNFDIIIFYGGGNETLQYQVYDPRIGYPYNFFFRQELTPFKQSILRYSSILGEIDKLTGLVSGKSKLDSITKSNGWEKQIIDNYWRDLSVANKISSNIVKPNVCKKTIFVSITQPANPISKKEQYIWKLLNKSIKFNSYDWIHYDLTKYQKDVNFKDTIHINQISKIFLAEKISKLLYKIYNSNCLSKNFN